MRRLALLTLLLAGAAGVWLLVARDRGTELAAAPPAVASDDAARRPEALDRVDAPVPVTTAGDARTQLALEPEASGDSLPADPRPGVPFHGRVVSSAGGTPVPFARIMVLDGAEGNAVEADADGRFFLTLVLRKGRADLGVTAAGFSQSFVTASGGYEDPSHPLLVWLTPYASLDVAVRGPDGAALSGVTVYLSAPSWSLRTNDTLLQWRSGIAEGYANQARTGADGVARFERVPAEIALLPRILGPDVDRTLEEIALLPAEHGTLDVSIAHPVTVEGIAVRPDGTPAEALVLWLVDAVTESPHTAGMPRYLRKHDEKQAVAKAVTDAGGRFVFSAVAPGRYWIGPPEPPEDAAAIAEPLVVGMQDVVLDLELAPALAIRGTVVDKAGAPYDASVNARASSASYFFAFAKSEGGRFAFEGLAPGRFTLAIGGEQIAGPLEVDAGAEGVLLRVVPSSSVHGRIVGGVRDVGMVSIGLSATDSFAKYGRYVNGGVDTFEIAAPPGRYSFRAATSDGWIGTATDVLLEPGRVTELPPVELVRGQRLRVRNDGERLQNVQIVAGRAEIEMDGLHPGAARVFLVPTGAVTVRLLGADGVACDETTVNVEAGVAASVALDCF
jgi:hypothetical protein